MVFALGSERPKCSTFPALIGILDRAGHVFDRHGEVDAVLVVEIDAVGPEALQRFLDDPPMRSGRLSNPFVPSILKPNLVAMATLSRTGARASPTRSSLT